MQYPIQDFIAICQDRIQSALHHQLSTQNIPAHELCEAIKYSVGSKGKRIRPILVYATGLSLGATWEQLDIPACAVELIHTYSLIHDDLPAMDDDDFRREQPSCHKAFNEATAILAGDGLQTLAFEILARDIDKNLSPAQRLSMITSLATYSGITGMVSGQALDLAATNQKLSLEKIEHIHHLKTGALFKACVELGAIAANCENTAILFALREFASCLGLAFQIQDDISDTQIKPTQIKSPLCYVRAAGLKQAQTKVQQLREHAFSLISHQLPNGTLLHQVENYLT